MKRLVLNLSIILILGIFLNTSFKVEAVASGKWKVGYKVYPKGKTYYSTSSKESFADAKAFHKCKREGYKGAVSTTDVVCLKFKITDPEGNTKKLWKQSVSKYTQNDTVKVVTTEFNTLNDGKNIEYCNHGVEVTAIETNKSKFSNKSNCSLINKSQYPNLYSNILQHKLPYPRNCSYRPGLCKFKSSYFIETKTLNKYLKTQGIENSNLKIAENKDKKKIKISEIEYCDYKSKASSIEINKSKFSNKPNCNIVNKENYPVLYSELLNKKISYPRNCNKAITNTGLIGLCKFKSSYYISTKELNKSLQAHGIDTLNTNLASKKTNKKKREIEYCNYSKFSSIEINKTKFHKKSNCNVIDKVENPLLYSEIFSQIRPYPRNCASTDGFGDRLCKFTSSYYITSKALDKSLAKYAVTNKTETKAVTNKTETKLVTNKKVILDQNSKQLELIFCKYNNSLDTWPQREFPQSVYLNFKEEGCNKYISPTGRESKFSKKKNLEISYEDFLKKRKKFYGICYSKQSKKISYKKNCHKKESFVRIIKKDGSFENINVTKIAKKDTPAELKKTVEVSKKETPKQDKFVPKEIDEDNDPPIIKIASAITVNDASYEFQGKVTDKAKLVFVEIDGRATEVKGGKFTVKGYSPVDKEITIEAIDQWGNRSKPKIVKLTIDIKDTNLASILEPLNPLQIKTDTNNDRVALIIGIEKYDRSPDASFANLDAKYFYEYARKGFGISKSNIKLLVDEDANLIQSLATLNKWLPGKVKSGQTDLVIFFAGHGLASNNGEELYLLSQDSDPDLLSRTALSRTELFAEIINLNPKSVTMFLDTCYSGVSREEETLLASARPVRIIADEQDTPNNFTIFSASQLDQISSGLSEAKHGIFSYYLMKGLEGKADINQDKKITNGELLAYMDENVSEKAAELGREQNPSLTGDPDKVLISYR